MATAFKQVKNNAKSLAVSGSLNNVTTPLTFSLQADGGAKFPDTAQGSFWVTIWDAVLYPNDPKDDPNMEIALVTARSGDNLTITRGQLGTSAVVHVGIPTVRLLVQDQHLKDLYLAVNTIEDLPQITNFAESVDDRVASFLVAGTGISLTYNDVSNTLTVNNTSLGFRPSTYIVATTASGYVADYYCDGTDDQVQIQQAYDAATTNGGEVLIKQGTYTTSAAIFMRSNVWLRGEGWKTKIRSTGSTPYSILSYTGTSAGAPLADLAVTDILLDGSGQTLGVYDTGAKAIFSKYTVRFLIQNVYAYGCAATGIGTDFMVDCVIDSCVAEGNGRQWPGEGFFGANGIGIGTGGYANETLTITNCHAINNGNNGIMFESQNGSLQAKYMHVVNCTSRGNNKGYRNAGTANVTFTTCSAFENVKDGFHFDRSPFGGFYAQHTIIDTCQIKDNGENGIKAIDSTATTSMRMFNIRGCIIHNNALNGITATTANRWRIEGNQIGQNGLSGIKLTCSTSSSKIEYVAITDNTIFNNGTAGTASDDDGILLSASGTGSFNRVSIEHNTCFDNQGTKTQDVGVKINGTHTSTTVRFNDLVGNITNGLEVLTVGTGSKIYDNTGVDEWVNVTANYTATESRKYIFADATSGNIVVTLPPVASVQGKIYTIKKMDISTNTVTVDANSTELIEGIQTRVLHFRYQVLKIIAEGSAWRILNQMIFTDVGDSVVYNGNGYDWNFRFEGTSSDQLLFLDAGLNAVQIGTTVAGDIADFRSTAIVFNEAGGNIDFRIEGDTNANLFYTQASTDRIGMGNTAPASRLNVGIAGSAALDTQISTNGITIASTDAVLLGLENTATSGSGAGSAAGLYSNDGAAMASGDRLGILFFWRRK